MELKERLTTALILALPTIGADYVVYSDPFQTGLGCVLMQTRRLLLMCHAPRTPIWLV